MSQDRGIKFEEITHKQCLRDIQDWLLLSAMKTVTDEMLIFYQVNSYENEIYSLNILSEISEIILEGLSEIETKK